MPELVLFGTRSDPPPPSRARAHGRRPWRRAAGPGAPWSAEPVRIKGAEVIRSFCYTFPRNCPTEVYVRDERIVYHKGNPDSHNDISAAALDPIHAMSFVSSVMAAPIADPARQHAAFYEPLWALHVYGSCLFIAYVPVKRLIHSCATPMGRLMNSQTRALEAKRLASISGLFRDQRA